MRASDTASAGGRFRHLLAATLWLSLAACAQREDAGQQELRWARAALERNPGLEVVASDEATGILTVRDRRTGELRAVASSEVVAMPPGRAMTSAPPSPAPDVANVPEPATPARSTDAASVPDGEESPSPEATAADQLIAADGAGPGAPEYTIERSAGQVKVSGPGVSIVTGGSEPPATARGAPGQRTVDPIICEGPRMLHLDGRDIFVDGDAITVRGGCELFVSNSRIVASGTGVVVRDGVVSIANSYVEGAAATFDAGDHAKLYLRDTVFQGLSRRTKHTAIEDQGGNRGLPVP